MNKDDEDSKNCGAGCFEPVKRAGELGAHRQMSAMGLLFGGRVSSCPAAVRKINEVRTPPMIIGPGTGTAVDVPVRVTDSGDDSRKGYDRAP